MPLPEPQPDESRQDFMSRCVVDEQVMQDFGDVDRRVAVCARLFEGEGEQLQEEEMSIEDMLRRLLALLGDENNG